MGKLRTKESSQLMEVESEHDLTPPPCPPPTSCKEGGKSEMQPKAGVFSEATVKRWCVLTPAGQQSPEISSVLGTRGWGSLLSVSIAVAVVSSNLQGCMTA